MRFSFLDETETKYIRKMFTWEMGTICTKYGVNFNLVMVSYNLCDRIIKTDFWYQFLKIKLIKKCSAIFLYIILHFYRRKIIDLASYFQVLLSAGIIICHIQSNTCMTLVGVSRLGYY